LTKSLEKQPFNGNKGHQVLVDAVRAGLTSSELVLLLGHPDRSPSKRRQ